MALKVCGHRVMIRPQELKKKTESGIIIEYGENEKLEKAGMTRGIIAQIGNDAWKTMYINSYQPEPWCKVGDEVIHAKYIGFEVVDPETNETFRVVNDEDIIVVISKEGVL